MSRLLTLLLLILMGQGAWAQVKVWPPSWWVGMRNPRLQLMFHAPGIGQARVSCEPAGALIIGVYPADDGDYLFVDLDLSDLAHANELTFRFTLQGRRALSCSYTLSERPPVWEQGRGFGPADVIYMAFPDRFTNGDPTNDSIPGMLQGSRRQDPDHRHGGDLQGVIDHLDYLEGMGFTALWLTPVQENNMPAWSYHGYAITDAYQVDPRLGNNALYRALADSAHARGIRLIMDVVLNHWGDRNALVQKPPFPAWINAWPEFTRTTYRSVTLTDPHASVADRERFQRGWFDRHMPDLNLDDPFLLTFMVQHTIWWIEYAGLDGLRLDTQPYAGLEGVAAWATRVKAEYPELDIVGEAWLDYPAYTAFYQGGKNYPDEYNSGMNSVTDFPLHYALRDAFTQEDGWNEGTLRIYQTLAQDFLYVDPGSILTFADNHDVGRIFSSVNEDPALLRMALGTLLTTRGTPMIYYGTEVLMPGKESEGHGPMRKDFPGGWPGDSVDAFTGRGLSPAQAEMQEMLRKLLNYRKGAKALHTGRLLHYLPEDGVYTYFRLHEHQRVMVIVNNARQTVRWMPERFAEGLGSATRGIEVVSGQMLIFDQGMDLAPKSIMILELQ